MGFKGKVVRLGLVSALALSAMPLASPANAQLLGVCPSPFWPPPCIIFDYKRLAELSKEHAQQIQRIQDMARQVQQTKASAESIGKSIANIGQLAPADIVVGDGDSFTSIAGETPQQLISNFSQTMFGGQGLSLDQQTDLIAKRTEEDVRANVDTLAVALTASSLVEQSHKRMACLGQAAKESADLRGDWAINSQIKLEIARQSAQKNHLLAVYLQNVATDAAVSARPDQSQSIHLGSGNAAPPIPARSPAWDLQDQLEDVESLIRKTLSILAISKGAKDVLQDARSVQQQYENVETRRQQALNRLKSRAYAWSSRHGSTIVNTTLAELNRIDSQMAALRSRPISNLSGAFRERNIDAAAMMQNDVDPRQFIGTWGDPLKNQVTLDMANSLLKGRLDDYIDGDDDNDEYRDLVLAYNDVRLEEAWMRTYAQEASKVGDEISGLLDEESGLAGYDVNPETVEAELRELVERANNLGQQIQQTGDEVPISQATRTLQKINDLLNGNEAASNPSPDPDVPVAPPSPNPSPDPEPPMRDIPGNPWKDPRGGELR